MKKLVALTLLTMLVLALCLPIFARYEPCGQCFNGRLSVTKKTSTVTCPTCNKSVTRTTYTETCSNCEYVDVSYKLSCGDTWVAK